MYSKISGSRYSKTKILALAALVSGALLATTQFGGGASAAPQAAGDLDPTFGTSGKVVTDFGSNLDEVHGIAFQADGKIVAAGEAWPSHRQFALARYNSNGSLDTSFGTGGKVLTAFSDNGSDSAAAVVLQGDKIVAAGYAWNPGVHSTTFALARYNSNGTLDTSFGTDGKVLTNIDTINNHESEAQAITIAPDGKLVVAGYVGHVFILNQFAVARYDANGNLDNSFGTGGIATYDSGVGENTGRAVAVQPDGKVIVGGNISAGGGNDDFGVVRFTASGSLDPSFGTGGVVQTDFLGGKDRANGMVLRPDGKIVLGGLAQIDCPSSCERYGFAMAQYTSNGDLDPAFADGVGAVVYDFVSTTAAYSLARRSDGGLVMAGHESSSDFAVALFDENGALDPNFNNGNLVTTDFSTFGDRAYAVAVDSDGKIVAAGRTGALDFAIARYQAPALGGDPTPTPIATVTPPPSSCQIEFTDVPGNNTFYPYVQCLACREIDPGFACGGPNEPCDTQNNNYFRPNSLITRDDLAHMVAASAGFNEDPGERRFQDVPPTHQYYAWIQRMANRGLIGGYPCGGPNEPCVGPDNLAYYRPSANATRGQIAKIVANGAGYNETPTDQMFEDVPSSQTFYQWVQRLASRGVMGGYQCGGVNEPCGADSKPYFRWGNNATRGQVAKIVANTFFPNCIP